MPTLKLFPSKKIYDIAFIIKNPEKYKNDAFALLLVLDHAAEDLEIETNYQSIFNDTIINDSHFLMAIKNINDEDATENETKVIISGYILHHLRYDKSFSKTFVFNEALRKKYFTTEKERTDLVLALQNNNQKKLLQYLAKEILAYEKIINNLSTANIPGENFIYCSI